MKEKVAFLIPQYGPQYKGGSNDLCKKISDALSDYYAIDIISISSSNKYNQENNKRLLYFNSGCELKQYMYEKQTSYKAILVINTCSAFYDIFLFWNNIFFMPLMHDLVDATSEVFMQLGKNAYALLFLTEEEQQCFDTVISLRNRKYSNSMFFIEEKQLTKLNIEKKDEYVLYLGRVSEQKNYYELNDFFIRYKTRHPSGLRLKVAGLCDDGMNCLYSSEIDYLGFVDEVSKKQLIQNAKALIIPSLYESLSIVLLEALQLGIPVIVNGKCNTLRGQCLRSGGGVYYFSFEEFESRLMEIFANCRVRAIMSENGKRYVNARYSRDVVIGKYIKLFNKEDIEIEEPYDSNIDIMSLLQKTNILNEHNSSTLPSRGGIEYRRFIRSAKEMSKIVIVGAGNAGRHALQTLKFNGIDDAIVAFADNYSSGMCSNKIIMTVDKAVAEYKDAFFIVTPIKAKWRLIEQLIGLGVDMNRIELFFMDYQSEVTCI